MARTTRTAPSARPSSASHGRQGGMLRGSLIELRRRCGKAGCHCREGEPHISPALSYSRNGKTHILTLPVERVAEVKAGLKRYHQALRRLEEQALHGLEALTQRLQREKQAARRAKS